MKSLKYLLIFLWGSFVFTGCVEDEAPSEQYTQSVNTITFDNSIQEYSGIADGSSYDIKVPIRITGPTTDNVSGDLTVQIGVDPTSTAREGENFTLQSSTLTLTRDQDYLGNVVVTMLTDGIEAPLATSPVAVLTVSQVDGDGNVVADAGRVSITLNYACPSVLAGTYDVTTVRDDGFTNTFVESITETGVGRYKTESTGTWAIGAIAPDQGLTFTDVCDQLNVPLQDLAQGFYSNDVFGNETTTVNEDGSFQLRYTISFGSGDRTYTSTYVPR